MPYKTWATNDVPSAADFNQMFGDAQTADVAANETTTSTSYGDLTTPGPSVSLAMVSGQQALVFITARLSGSTATIGPIMSFAVSGALTLAAADANGVENDDTGAATLTRATLITATSTATASIAAKYRIRNAGTGTFIERRIIAKRW